MTVFVNLASPAAEEELFRRLAAAGFSCRSLAAAEDLPERLLSAIVCRVDATEAKDLQQLRDVRRRRPGAWIVAVAEQPKAADIASLLQAGADDVSSPDPAELVRRLQVWIAQGPATGGAGRHAHAEEASFRSAWDHSIDGMRLTDMAGTMLAVNRSFCHIVEMSEEELIGRPLNVIFASTEDREGMLRRYQQRFRDGQREFRFSRLIHLACGKSRYLEFSLSLFSTGGVCKCLTIIRDQTRRHQAEAALRQSEQHFRSVWESSSDGMRLSDEEGIILDVNDAFCRMVSMERRELVGSPITAHYSGEADLPGLLSSHKECFEQPAARGRFVDEVVLRGGGVIETEVSYAVLGETKENRRLLCLFRDMTARREEERQRLELERKVFESQRLDSLGVMAGGIAHDFNNLLTVIIGNAGLAAALVPANSPAQMLLANAEKTSMQAAELCKQMLAYAGRGKMIVRNVSLEDVLSEIDHLLRVSIGPQVTLRIDSPPGLPSVNAEPSQLQQVVVNLVLNASEAIGAEAGTVHVSLSSRHLDERWLAGARCAPELSPGQFVLLQVSDTGAGMAADLTARIFDPFFSTKFTGRGLGLASVLGIVRRHGGAIRVQSEQGKGTIFEVALPVAPTRKAPSFSNRNFQEIDAGPRLVLVIDDEEPVRAVTEAILRHARYDVALAVDGEDGLRLFKAMQDRLCGVLLDLTMPGMDGATVLSRIRQLRPEMPVLLMSGYSDADVGATYAEQPATSFLAKPFSRESLQEKLDNLLLRQRVGCP